MSEMTRPAPGEASYDAIVVGAGFGGVYMTHRLKNLLGLNVLCLEAGSEVGGTWYWNRYPGARSDAWSHMYRYSPHAFGEELLDRAELGEWYRPQAEIQGYIESVVDSFDLRSSIRLNTTVESAAFDEASATWRVRTHSGEELATKYLIPAMGRLSKPFVPDIDGIDSFEGELFHSSRWPVGETLAGKRVGIIGTGSTGIQIITTIAKEVEHLTVFQRTAQYVVPANNREYSAEDRSRIRREYREIWANTRTSRNANSVLDLPENARRTHEVSDREREEIFEQAWQRGNGFAFTSSFNDFDQDLAANEAAASFVRAKIVEIVRDPETRRKIMPSGPWSRRPLCVDNYYETYNRENVSLVALRETPIVKVRPEGVETADGVVHEIDVLIIATGYDSGDGAIRRVPIAGRGGRTLAEYWPEISTSYLGTSVSTFPNLLILGGPQGAVTPNNLPGIEATVEQISEVIEEAERRGARTIEVRHEAELKWTERVATLVEGSIAFNDKSNWFFGGNIPGKAFGVRGYYGSLSEYYEETARERESGFASYVFD